MAVTGVGVVSPNGIGKESFWRTLRDGQSAISPISFFDASDMSTRMGGEIKQFDAGLYLDSRVNPKRHARHTQLGLVAATLALEDAHADSERLAKHQPLPIVVGIGTSAMDLLEDGITTMNRAGANRVSPYIVASTPPHAFASALSDLLGVQTQARTLSSACAAGLDAVSVAADMIRSGQADMVIAGGTDAPLNRFTFASFVSMRLMSRRNDEPQRASRPFDRDRDGGLLAEGAGIVVLENLDSARARGVRPYLEITGSGSSVDGNGEPAAHGFGNSMREALANGNRMPRDVDYISAHGPSDKEIDREETRQIKAVFGDRAYKIPVSSIKGVTGNPLAGAGPMQLIATSLAMQHGEIPPTANYSNPDPDCDLDYVGDGCRRHAFDCALINTHGVGGANGTLVVERI